MISKIHTIHKSLAHKDGFTAMVAVIMCSLGTLGISLAALGAASSYADSVYTRELRIQVGLYREACLDTLELMVRKDYFLNGKVTLPEFHCQAMVTNDYAGGVQVEVSIGNLH